MQEAHERAPKDSLVCVGWGTALAEKHDYNGAIEISADTRIRREDADAYYNWGITLNAKHDYDRGDCEISAGTHFTNQRC